MPKGLSVPFGLSALWGYIADYAPLPRPQRGAEHYICPKGFPSPLGFQPFGHILPTTALYMPKGLPEGAKAKGL